MQPQDVGNLIRTLRKERGLTQKDVAARLGITDKTVSKWERGRGIPDISMFPGLSALFEVDPAALLEGRMSQAGPVGGNMKRLKFYVCDTCGNILTATGGGELFCCGRKLEPLKPHEADGPHQPSAVESDGELYVTLAHPMAKEHFLSFAALADDSRVILVKLYPEQEPAFRLPLHARGAMYLYCTGHGLFKAKL